MTTGPIIAALRNRANAVRQVNAESAKDIYALRDAATLLRVLANIMGGMAPIQAFGPPGDWGYETEIGQAVVAMHARPASAQPLPEHRETTPYRTMPAKHIEVEVEIRAQTPHP